MGRVAARGVKAGDVVRVGDERIRVTAVAASSYTLKYVVRTGEWVEEWKRGDGETYRFRVQPRVLSAS